MMFVVFTLAAFVLFMPVVLFPLIRDHCQLLADETQLKLVTADLEKELVRQEALVQAFKEDATVNERLAVLDLHYNNPSEETVNVLPSHFAIMPAERAGEPAHQSVLKIPATWPDRIRQYELWAQRHGLIDLFMDHALQPVFLLMAGGLIVAALVLFAPRVQPESARVIQPQASRELFASAS